MKVEIVVKSGKDAPVVVNVHDARQANREARAIAQEVRRDVVWRQVDSNKLHYVRPR